MVEIGFHVLQKAFPLQLVRPFGTEMQSYSGAANADIRLPDIRRLLAGAG
jgi:hypothetical protein